MSEATRKHGPWGNRLTRHGARTVAVFTAILAGLLAGGAGWATFVGSLSLFILTTILCLGSWLAVLAFFRNPPRNLQPEANRAVAPADGKVIGIERVENEEYVGGPATRVSIFLSVFNVHVNRTPVAGVVDYLSYRRGTFRNALQKEARETNERQALGLRMADGTRVLVRQIAGLIARRIVCPVKEGERLPIGFDYGMIRFGSQTEVSIPDRPSQVFRVHVTIGQVVHGGETIIGAWEPPVMPPEVVRPGTEEAEFDPSN